MLKLVNETTCVFFEGKIVPQHQFYLDFNHKAKKFETVLVSNIIVVKL